MGVDPGTLPEAQRTAARIPRLPSSLGEALEAAAADQGLLLRARDQRGLLAPRWPASVSSPHRGRPPPPPPPHTHTRPNAVRAVFLASLSAATQSQTLVRAFLAVRRSEWQHFGSMSLEKEAAELFSRY